MSYKKKRKLVKILGIIISIILIVGFCLTTILLQKLTNLFIFVSVIVVIVFNVVDIYCSTLIM